MSGSFRFELVSPERLLVSGDVEQVLVPGVEGDMTVLAHHAPLLTTLRPGLLAIGYPSGEHQRYFIRGGFAEVSPSGLTVLAEHIRPTPTETGESVNSIIGRTVFGEQPAQWRANAVPRDADRIETLKM